MRRVGSHGIGFVLVAGAMGAAQALASVGDTVFDLEAASRGLPCAWELGWVALRDALVLPPLVTPCTGVASLSDLGVLGDSSSVTPAVSADGRAVAFGSFAANLVPGDLVDEHDVFVHDLASWTVERVSVGFDGAEADGFSAAPSISADGRFVAFHSSASNLVPGDTGRRDVFVRDRAMGVTTVASRGLGGAIADDFSINPAISADGRFVAFESIASNLVAGDTNSRVDIFVHDGDAGTTERVSLAANGDPIPFDNSADAAISADGRFVAFETAAPDLVPEDTDALVDVYVRDRIGATTERASVSTAGEAPDDASLSPSISGDGRFVAFESAATNLVDDDANERYDVFVRDRVLGTTTRVSVPEAGGEGDGDSFQAAISPDGRTVAFKSFATNLVAGDENGRADVFVVDRETGEVRRASVDRDGAEVRDTDGGHLPALSEGARVVAFESTSDDLVPDRPSTNSQIFIRHRDLNPGW